MTLYEFLNTVNADYTAPATVPLVWTTDDVTGEEVAQANGNPFVRVVEYGIEVRQKWQDAIMLSRVIQLSVFQEGAADQRGIPRDKMQAVWDKLFYAPDSVNECTYGDEDFVKLEYISGFPPAHDTSSGGLASAVRFRLWFARRAKAQ